jgi:hypothetical protein
MDKSFFESFDQRKKDFAARAGVGDEVRAELVLGSGRILVVDKIVETADGWLHVDGYDVDAEDKLLSLVMPYYGINHVLFMKPKARPQAGFR